MKKLKTLSGAEVCRILAKFGFIEHSQRGSHIKLRRQTLAGRQTLTIPNHKTLVVGTLLKIYRDATMYIREDELRQHFYND